VTGGARHRVLRAGGGWAATHRWYLAKMTKGGNLTEQSSLNIHSDDRRQAQQHGLFRAADQLAEDQHASARSIAPGGAAAQPSWDVFSHASEYDVAEQQRSATPHDEAAMRSLRLPFAAEADIVDAIDQRRSVPVDEDDYR
jgi:hypothetical protein